MNPIKKAPAGNQVSQRHGVHKEENKIGITPHGSASAKQRFPASVLELIRNSKILGIRAGTMAHRFTGIWVVVVNGRVFVRPWNNKASGWYRAFLKEPCGAIQIPGGREIPVRAKRTKSERLMDAVDQAYGEKYHTPASRKYVRGFARAARRMTTTELVPA